MVSWRWIIVMRRECRDCSMARIAAWRRAATICFCSSGMKNWAMKKSHSSQLRSGTRAACAKLRGTATAARGGEVS